MGEGVLCMYDWVADWQSSWMALLKWEQSNPGATEPPTNVTLDLGCQYAFLFYCHFLLLLAFISHCSSNSWTKLACCEYIFFSISRIKDWCFMSVKLTFREFCHLRIYLVKPFVQESYSYHMDLGRQITWRLGTFVNPKAMSLWSDVRESEDKELFSIFAEISFHSDRKQNKMKHETLGNFWCHILCILATLSLNVRNDWHILIEDF